MIDLFAKVLWPAIITICGFVFWLGVYKAKTGSLEKKTAENSAKIKEIDNSVNKNIGKIRLLDARVGKIESSWKKDLAEIQKPILDNIKQIKLSNTELNNMIYRLVGRHQVYQDLVIPNLKMVTLHLSRVTPDTADSVLLEMISNNNEKLERYSDSFKEKKIGEVVNAKI